MLVKCLRYLWQKKFLQYSIIGTSAFVLDFTTLIILKEIFGFNPILAVVLNQVLVINYVFFLNKCWSFQCNGQTGKQLFKFLILMLWNYIFAVGWMYFFTHIVHWSLMFHILGKIRDVGYLAVRLVNILLAVSWNFLLYKYWIFRQPIDKINTLD